MSAMETDSTIQSGMIKDLESKSADLKYRAVITISVNLRKSKVAESLPFDKNVFESCWFEFSYSTK